MLARDSETSSLKRTPLHALHLARGAKMVPFAGYEMPVQYSSGVMKEHLHTRAGAGLFDVSHMGQIALHAKSGKVEDAALALERLVPQDILGVAPGRQRYAQLTNSEGGILDDLMVANFGSHLFLVVNAACKAEDEAHLRTSLQDACVIEPLANRALIALQGPKAESVLATLCPDAPAMRFGQVAEKRKRGCEAERNQTCHRNRPLAAWVLRQIAACSRQLQTRKRRERPVVDRDRAGIAPQEAGKRHEQGGFARAIGPDDRHERSSFGAKGDIIQYGAAASLHADERGFERRHGDVPLRRTTSQKKNGVPSRLVKTPSFISGPKWIRRVAMSAVSNRTAPAKAAGTRTRRG